MREVLRDQIRLVSGQRIAWGQVRRILLESPGALARVPRQVVSPGDTVTLRDAGTLFLKLRLVRGELLDVRHSELLLGRLNLVLPEGAEVRFNGQITPLAGVPRFRAALARYDVATGRVGRLEVVDPGRPGGAPDVWAVRAGLWPGAVAPTRALRAGEELHLELRATARGTAAFDLAGVVWNLPGREVSPGVYRATFRVPQGLDARGTFALGRYSRGGVDRPVRVGPSISLAPTAPRVLQQGPEGRATAGAPVFARYESEGAAIDAARVRLEVDGADVTRVARRTVDLVFWEPQAPLAPGLHRVRLDLADTAGNRVQRSWSFRVKPGS